MLQNHIHLDTELATGGDKAPIKTWRATARRLIPNIIARPERALTGELHVSVLKVISTPKLFRDWSYTIRIRGTQAESADAKLEELLSLVGQTVYLVDHQHCPDGEDHTDYIKEMFFVGIGEIPVQEPGAQFYDVEIELLDKSL